jgi:hypothetical protein
MTETPEKTYCVNHPNRETSLRCNKCGKLICSQCAVHTPIGYRCPECIKTQQKIFNSAKWYDYPLGFFIALGISFAGSLIVPRLGFFVLFLAPLVGMAIAELTRLAIQKRRSKRLFLVIAAGAMVGGVPSLLMQLVPLLLFLSQAGGSVDLLLSTVWHGAYVIMVTSTTYYRVSGLIFNR